jgi:glutaredoxin 3
MAGLELYGAASCPHTREMREWLEWRRKQFDEFDVEQDKEARERMRMLTEAPYRVPFLVQDGKVVEVGWQGQVCFVESN